MKIPVPCSLRVVVLFVWHPHKSGHASAKVAGLNDILKFLPFSSMVEIYKKFQTVYKHNFETNTSFAFYRKEQILKMSGIPGYRYISTHEKPYLFNWLTTTETTYDIPKRRYSLRQATTKLRQTITMGYGILLFGDGIAHGCHGRFTTATSRGSPLKLYAVFYNIP